MKKNLFTYMQEAKRAARAANKENAQKQKRRKENKVANELRKGKCAKADTEEYIAYFRVVIRAVYDGKLSPQAVYDGKLLEGVGAGTSVSVQRIRHWRQLLKKERREYMGPKKGRPRYDTDKGAAVLGEILINGRQTRNMVNKEDDKGKDQEKKLYREIINQDLKSRNRKPLDPGKPVSPQTVKKLRARTGVSDLKTNAANKNREEAVAAARNLLTNYAGARSLIDAEFTYDGMPVHLSQRINIDAVTVTSQKAEGTSLAVTKRTALMDANPELDAAWEASKGIPATHNAEGGLCQAVKVVIATNGQGDYGPILAIVKGKGLDEDYCEIVEMEDALTHGICRVF